MKFKTQQTDIDMPAMKTLQDVHEEEALAKELQELRDLLKSLEDQHAAGQVVSEDAEKTMRDEVARLRTEIAKAIQRQEEMMQAAQANSGDFTPVSKESDRMVDQIERAEVAEEKRAVFRALTRLRGAAITSYDGIARSQTGNIDEYNHKNKWRDAHPLHHLADEESDVSHWAFPDNAD